MPVASPTSGLTDSALAGEPGPASPLLHATFTFLRQRAIFVVLCSAILLVPCFWHRHIQAGDLGSHVYNAWLAQLIHDGQAPRLYLSRQTDNVLFDWMLSTTLRLFGPIVAERFAVSLSVLVFFWGAFALASAATKRVPWEIVPLLAMLAYGFTFNIGFFNCYLSVGFSFFAMAILWRGARWDFVLIAPLLALTWLAHPLGTLGLLVLGSFVFAARFLRWRAQFLLTLGLITAYFVARWFLVKHCIVLPPAANVFWMAGADQLVVFGNDYQWIALLVLLLGVSAMALFFLRKRREALVQAAVWLQLYALMAIVVVTAPGGLWHPIAQTMGYLPDRASLYATVLMATLLAISKPPKWLAALFCSVAVMFFAMLYLDTRALDQSEAKLESLVSIMHPPQRVVPTIFPRADWRIRVQHSLDRACIGHCFEIANYEPSAGQFRVRANNGSHIATASSLVSDRLQRGTYKVHAEDLPLTEIHACGPRLQDFCIHELQAGEISGQAAVEEINARIR